MRTSLRQRLLGLGLALSLAACGGGGGGGSDDSTNASAPRAQIAASATTLVAGQSVTLDGSASTSPGGGTLTYQWTIEQRPQGSSATLSTPTAVRTAFTPDVAGSYLISLAVHDGASRGMATQITLQVSSLDPVAIVVPQISQRVGSVIQLDGSGSLPPTGGNRADLRYAWVLTGKPDGSTAALDNANLAQPRFTADQEGQYKATLTVTHGGRTSSPAIASIVISKANALPVANAGSDIADAVRGQRVTLDGSGSSDADGDTLQYRWTLRAPNGSKAQLQNATTVSPSFVPDIAGSYEAELNVFDGTSRNAESARVYITAEVPAGAPNTRPVAVIAPPYLMTFEVERDKPFQLMGASSYDADGTFILSANREWTLLSAPVGFDAQTNFNKRFTPITASEVKGTHYGDYVVQLRVTDGIEWSEPVTATYTVMNGANRPPIATATVQGAGAAIQVGSTVTLSGETSSDPDANRLTYAWTLLDRPDGSNATLRNANTMTPSFVADRAGPYSASLLVTDEHGFSSTTPSEITLLARVTNHEPVLRTQLRLATEDVVAYTKDQPLVIRQYASQMLDYPWGLPDPENYPLWSAVSAYVDGYDPDGDEITYLWALTQEPAGARLGQPYGRMCTNSTWQEGTSYQQWLDTQLALRLCSSLANGGNSQNLRVAPLVPGAYRLELSASDGIGFTGPVVFDFEAVERAGYPTLLLEDMLQDGFGYNPYGIPNSYGYIVAPQQQVFPYCRSLTSFSDGNCVYNSQQSWFVSLLASTNIAKTFQLTAFDRDYTIAGLEAASAKYPTFTPRFEGLRNGDVIRKGETVQFKLVLDYAGGEPENLEGVTWKFAIAEKPDWTFQFGKPSP